MTRPIYANMGDHGPRLNLVDPEQRRRVVQLLASIPSPAEFRENAFENQIDLDTVRAVVLGHRHVETGLWQLRLDGLKKPMVEVYREKDHRKKPGYWNLMTPRPIYRHWGGDYGGIECFSAPYSKKTLPDGTSRLLAKTLAHFASQIFGERKLASWKLPTGGDPNEPNIVPLPDHLRDLA